MPQSKQIRPSGVSITSRSIISQLWGDPKLNEMLGKFNAGAGQDDLKSELFAVLCEKDNDFICDLWSKNQLLFYCTGIVQRMIFQPGNRFHRRYRTQSYEFTEAILNTTDEEYNADKEKKLQDLEAAMDKDLHWVENAMVKLHQDLGSMEKISKVTKISFNQVDRIYKKAKEKLRTSLSGKLMGNYIVVTGEFILDIPQDVTPDNINDILDETLDYMKMRLEGRMIPSKEKTNGYIKDIKPLKAKKII
jgi:uncharacterized membrane-anchored protein YjiN (DUF445 family)